MCERTRLKGTLPRVCVLGTGEKFCLVVGTSKFIYNRIKKGEIRGIEMSLWNYDEYGYLWNSNIDTHIMWNRGKHGSKWSLSWDTPWRYEGEGDGCDNFVDNLGGGSVGIQFTFPGVDKLSTEWTWYVPHTQTCDLTLGSLGWRQVMLITTSLRVVVGRGWRDTTRDCMLSHVQWKHSCTVTLLHTERPVWY